MDILVVILHFKRTENMRAIVDAMRKQTVSPRIALWNNGAQISNPEVDYFFQSPENLYCMARWHVASLLASEYVCIIDDDMIPATDDLLEKCARACRSHGDKRIIGYAGKRLGPGPDYYSGGQRVLVTHTQAREVPERFVDVVLGQFMFMHVSLLRRVPLYCPYYQQRGDDIWISLKTAVARNYHVVPNFMIGALDALPDLDVGLSSDGGHYYKRDKLVSDMILNGEIEWLEPGGKEKKNARALSVRRAARTVVRDWLRIGPRKR